MVKRRNSVLIGIALIVMLITVCLGMIFGSRVHGKDGVSAATPIEISGKIIYKTSNTVRYNGKSQALLEEYSHADYKYNVDDQEKSLELKHETNFRYKIGSVWQYAKMGSEVFEDLNTETNNFVYAGVYKREVMIVNSPLHKQKEGEKVYFIYTIEKYDPGIVTMNATYRTGISGMKVKDISLPLGWTVKNAAVAETNITAAYHDTSVEVVYTVPEDGTEEYHLPLEGETTRSIKVKYAEKPSVKFITPNNSPKLIPNTSNITYNSGKYEGDVIKIVEAGTSPNRPGYTFSHWVKRGDESGTKYSAESNPVEDSVKKFKIDPEYDVYFDAVYKPKEDTKYSVNHYVENIDKTGFMVLPKETTNHTAETATYVGYNPDETEPTPLINKIKGFEFNGEKTIGYGAYAGAVSGTETLNLKFYYTRKTYKINYSKGDDPLILGEEPVDNSMYAFEKQITLSKGETLKKPGYTLSGWTDGISKKAGEYTVFDVNSRYDVNAPEEGTIITMTAKFIPNTDTQYKIEYYDNKTGQKIEEQNFKGTTDSEVKARLMKLGYRAVSHDGEILVGTVAADGSLVLRMYCEKIDYAVNFDLPEIDNLTKNYGDVITLPQVPEKTGYTAQGWQINGQIYQAGEEITVKGNINVVPYYTALENTDSNQMQNNNITTPAPAPPMSKGEIAGIVIGSMYALYFLLGAVILIIMKNKK